MNDRYDKNRVLMNEGTLMSMKAIMEEIDILLNINMCDA